jgi:hypothetical protein
MEKNWIFSNLGFMFILNNKGSQWVAPAIIANTAPMERT